MTCLSILWWNQNWGSSLCWIPYQDEHHHVEPHHDEPHHHESHHGPHHHEIHHDDPHHVEPHHLEEELHDTPQHPLAPVDHHGPHHEEHHHGEELHDTPRHPPPQHLLDLQHEINRLSAARSRSSLFSPEPHHGRPRHPEPHPEEPHHSRRRLPAIGRPLPSRGRGRQQSDLLGSVAFAPSRLVEG